MNLYPDCFPENFEEMLPSCAKPQERQVFRVCFTGNINADSFIGTYEERLRKGWVMKPRGLRVPGTFATSTFEDFGEINHHFNLMRQRYPNAIIAVGITAEPCGPSALSRDYKNVSNPNSQSHVDWWIYKNAHPYKYFEKVGNV